MSLCNICIVNNLKFFRGSGWRHFVPRDILGRTHDKCVKCNNKNEYSNTNECKRCEGDNIESCYLFSNVVNNICNQQSVNESNTCNTNSTVDMTTNGEITICNSNY